MTYSDVANAITSLGYQPPPSPWKRKFDNTNHEFDYRQRYAHHNLKERFDDWLSLNKNLDIDTKRVALKVSDSIVSLVSRRTRGGKLVFRGSGTVLECKDVDGKYLSTILTSASLFISSTELDNIEVNVYLADHKLYKGQVLAHDFHFNIATVQIESDAPLQTAILKELDDFIPINPSMILSPIDTGVGQLRPHSDLFKISPGDAVVAIGRHGGKCNELMAAPGIFSVDCCDLDCKELLKARCEITKCGIGGPLINCHGEVIGVNFYASQYTPFLPINIVSRCLEHFKEYGTFLRPLLGMELLNLYATRLSFIESIMKIVPDILGGVAVEEVISESPADRAGILCNDVIIQCRGNNVRSVLEFLGMMWDKPGDPMELTLIRKQKRRNKCMSLIFVIDETSSGKFNRWPLPMEKKRPVSSKKCFWNY